MAYHTVREARMAWTEVLPVKQFSFCCWHSREYCPHVCACGITPCPHRAFDPLDPEIIQQTAQMIARCKEKRVIAAELPAATAHHLGVDVEVVRMLLPDWNAVLDQYFDDHVVRRLKEALWYPGDRDTEHVPKLTRRELEVLEQLIHGKTDREIADALVMSVRTVQNHLARLYARLGVRGRVDAVVYALRYRLVPLWW